MGQRVLPAYINTGGDRCQFVEGELPGIQQAADDLLRQIRQADDADVRAVVIHIVNHRVHTSLPDGEMIAVVLRNVQQTQKGIHTERVPLAGDGKAHGGIIPGVLVEPLNPVLLLQQRDRIAEEFLSLLGELYAPVAAGKDPNAQLLLQFPHGGGDAGLGQKELLRRFIDGTAFGDLHHIFQLLKGHARYSFRVHLSLGY